MTFNFDDTERAINVFKCIRWPYGVCCPRCNKKDIYKKGKQNKKQRYQCKSCKTNFNDFTGTPFHNLEIPMEKIFYILFNAYKHQTMKDISEELGISRPTVNSIVKQFKEYLKNETPLPKNNNSKEDYFNEPETQIWKF